MPTASKSSRTKQTRLAFTPLPSSSPAASTSPYQVQGRAAAIRYHDPSIPSKKRRIQNPHVDEVEPCSISHEDQNSSYKLRSSGKVERYQDVALPTPAPSSQLEPGVLPTGLEAEIPNSDPSVSSADVTSILNCQGAAVTHCMSGSPYSPASGTMYPPKIAHSRNALKSSTKVSVRNEDIRLTPRSNACRKRQVVSSSSSDSDTPENSSSHHETILRSGRAVRLTSNGRRLTRSMQAGQPSEKGQELAVLDEDHLHTISRDTSPQSRSLNSQIMISKKGSLNRNSMLSSKAKVSSKPFPNEDYDGQPSEEASENDIPRLTSASRSFHIPTKDKKSAKHSDATELSSNDEDSSDDLVVTPSRRKRFVATAPDGIHSNDGLDKDSVVSPTQKFRLRRLATRLESGSSPRLAIHVADELEDDLHDLRDTEVRKNRTRASNSTSSRTAFQRRLETIRRRRAGEDAPDSELEAEQSVDSEDVETGPHSYSDETGRVSEDSGTVIDQQSLLWEANEYDDEFLDDADDTMGAPLVLKEMPLEFTRHAHKKPLEHFKDAVEWMVHNKINPAFPRNDPVYLMAFRKLDDAVKGYAGSKFLSASWNSHFLTSLKAKPNFAVLEVPVISAISEGSGCEACNRRNHPGKYRITLSGRPYHHESLEPLSDGEDEDTSPIRHSRSLRLSDEDIHFSVGRFCKSNAATGHALLHWRYHLNEWVVDWLEGQQYLTPERIVEREKWSTRRRRDQANEIVDFMEETGEIKALHRDFRINVKSAEDAKPYMQRNQTDD